MNSRTRWECECFAERGMAQIAAVGCRDAGIESIGGTWGRLLVSLIDLGTNQITDVSPLSEVEMVTDLSLPSNLVSDISPLALLPRLNSLDVRDNQISDIAAFADQFDCQGLWQPTQIELSGNPLDAGDNPDLQKLIDKGCEVVPASF